MKKKIKAYIKLTIPARKATASPPIGPALGQQKVNIMEFCKEFNARTQTVDEGVPTPVVITVYEDNKFIFDTKTPPASYYLKQFAKISKGSSATKKEATIGKVTMSECREIARIKMEDLSAYDVKVGAKIIRGTAESMGIEIIED